MAIKNHFFYCWNIRLSDNAEDISRIQRLYLRIHGQRTVNMISGTKPVTDAIFVVTLKI